MWARRKPERARTTAAAEALSITTPTPTSLPPLPPLDLEDPTARSQHARHQRTSASASLAGRPRAELAWPDRKSYHTPCAGLDPTPLGPKPLPTLWRHVDWATWSD